MKKNLINYDLDDENIRKFVKGIHFNLYNILGAHKKKINGVNGVRFGVWAPNAKKICVIGKFNKWKRNYHILDNINNSGIWLTFIPFIGYNELYKFEITTPQNKVLVKTDPFAYYNELRPHNSSIIYNIDEYKWNDKKWLEKRKNQSLSKPINIYEIHLQSWLEGKNYFLNYKELAHKLVKYLKKMSFNYIEILPIMEHPLDDSWGYQLTGYFSITSRYGTPKDFQYFVDYMHKYDIGVILDWVPAHFSKDNFALSKFDGTHLYEHENLHPEWNSKIFDLKKNEVRNFLISSAMFYLEKYHVDGLRIDAVSSMLYLDHARINNEWDINRNKKNTNLQAINFFKQLNKVIKEKYCDVLIIAEEATAFKNVTKKRGLGFDLKWNMGWIYDILNYIKTPFDQRSKKHKYLIFPIVYAFNENFILSFSHDEVSIEKQSIYENIPSSNILEKLANLRLFYSYMICQPGKKLSFMGFELASSEKWNHDNHLKWYLLKNSLNKKFHTFVKDLNFLYLNKKAFWEDDFSSKGFKWVDFSDKKNSCISYLRIGVDSKILCIHNFSKNNLVNYLIRLKKIKNIKEIFNTNLKKYAGDQIRPNNVKISKNGVYLNITAFTTLIYEVEFESKKN